MSSLTPSLTDVLSARNFIEDVVKETLPGLLGGGANSRASSTAGSGGGIINTTSVAETLTLNCTENMYLVIGVCQVQRDAATAASMAQIQCGVNGVPQGNISQQWILTANVWDNMSVISLLSPGSGQRTFNFYVTAGNVAGLMYFGNRTLIVMEST